MSFLIFDNDLSLSFGLRYFISMSLRDVTGTVSEQQRLKLFYLRSLFQSYLPEANCDSKDRNFGSIRIAIEEKCDNKV